MLNFDICLQHLNTQPGLMKRLKVRVPVKKKRKKRVIGDLPKSVLATNTVSLGYVIPKNRTCIVCLICFGKLQISFSIFALTCFASAFASFISIIYSIFLLIFHIACMWLMSGSVAGLKLRIFRWSHSFNRF